MTKWQPTNTLSHINSILNPKGLTLINSLDYNETQITLPYEWYIVDFNGEIKEKYNKLIDVVLKYKDILYPTYDYESDYMEEI